MAEAIYHHPEAEIRARYLIRGTLQLTSPTSLSNGQGSLLTENALFRDEQSGQPLLSGTTLAGALRGYLTRRLPAAHQPRPIARLFGEIEEQARASHQSRLLVEDSYGTQRGVELRDGVALEPATRTAADRRKFDVELLAAGTTFPLQLEYWEWDDGEGAALRTLVAEALGGLTAGDITLGGRKRRGFGRCTVTEWQVYRYEMSKAADIVAWLEQDNSRPQPGATIQEMLCAQQGEGLPPATDCVLRATFALRDSLLIRAAPAQLSGPDMVQLRNADGKSVLSGTSLAGALRARARRIMRLFSDVGGAESWLNDLFGQEMQKPGATPRASRLWTQEATIQEPIQGAVTKQVQGRVKLDRFTGGAYPGALFYQQAAWGGELTLALTIRAPRERDVGLLLLLLKDLWTGDLPLGGEAGIGRGRLRGQSATLVWEGECWTITEAGNTGGLTIQGNMERLSESVVAIQRPVTEEVE